MKVMFKNLIVTHKNALEDNKTSFEQSIQEKTHNPIIFDI